MDTAVYPGYVVPPYYDSMIAKLISHGTTRDEARRKLIHGLEQTVAFGVTTNQAFLADCLRHPAFAAGEATTAFIGKHRDDLVAARDDVSSDAALAALLLYVTDPFAPPWRDGRTLAATFPIAARIELDHGIHDLEIVRERDRLSATCANVPQRDGGTRRRRRGVREECRERGGVRECVKVRRSVVLDRLIHEPGAGTTLRDQQIFQG